MQPRHVEAAVVGVNELGDGLPGVTVDRYGDYAVLHVASPEAERRTPELAALNPLAAASQSSTPGDMMNLAQMILDIGSEPGLRRRAAAALVDQTPLGSFDSRCDRCAGLL